MLHNRIQDFLHNELSVQKAFQSYVFHLIEEQWKQLFANISKTALASFAPSNYAPIKSIISSNKAKFHNAALFYNDVVSTSGYKENFTYQKDLPSSNKARRRRKIIWFNPPYSVNVETNIVETFLKLIDKHFPKTNNVHKICNRNNFKVSYSSLLKRQATAQDQLKCTCRHKNTYLQKGIA